MSWFRSKPAPVDTRLPLQEAIVASAWGYTQAVWLALPEQDRAFARTNHTKAPLYRGQA